MRLPVATFLIRFSQHILPQRFVNIRHYGIFSTRVKKEKLAQVRAARLVLSKEYELSNTEVKNH